MLTIRRPCPAGFRRFARRVVLRASPDSSALSSARLKQRWLRCIWGILVASGPAVAQIPPENEYVADPTFGTAGRFQKGFPGTLRDDGWFVVPSAGTYWVVGSATLGMPGSQTYRLTLSRLSASGAPITTFGVNGHLLTNIDGYPNGSAFVDSQGRLVVSLRTPLDQVEVLDSVVRILPTGALDWTWLARDMQGDNLLIADIAPAAGDGVWVSKQRQVQFANADLVRLTSSGVLDAGFGSLGSAQMGTFSPVFGGALERDAQGRIWWSPDGFSGQDRQQLIVRLTAAGALDTSYSGDGIAVLPSACDTLGSRDFVLNYLAVLPGDSAVVRFDIANSEASGVVAATPNGTPGPLRCEDSSGPVSASVGLAPRDASSFFAASRHCLPSGTCGPTLRRFLIQANGAIVEDPQFSVATAAATGTFMADGSGAGVIVDQGKPVVVGSVDLGGDYDIVVIRYGGPNFIFRSSFE